MASRQPTDRPGDDKTPPGQGKRQRKAKAVLAIWLSAKHIPPGKLVAAQRHEAKAMLREVCGVTDAEYVAAGGTLAED